MGGISKRGDTYLRRLLIHGARTVPRWRRARPETRSAWLDGLVRRPVTVVTTAMASKAARTVRAMLTSGETCHRSMPHPEAAA